MIFFLPRVCAAPFSFIADADVQMIQHAVPTCLSGQYDPSNTAMAVPLLMPRISSSMFLGKSVCVKCCEYILLQVIKNWFRDAYVLGCVFVSGF